MRRNVLIIRSERPGEKTPWETVEIVTGKSNLGTTTLNNLVCPLRQPLKGSPALNAIQTAKPKISPTFSLVFWRRKHGHADTRI